MNGSRPPRAPLPPYDPTEPGGPVDMRDVRALRDDLERVEGKVDDLHGDVKRSLLIQAATFTELTGKDVETIPGVGLLAARERRQRRAVSMVAATVAFALLAFGSGILGARTVSAQGTHHAP